MELAKLNISLVCCSFHYSSEFEEKPRATIASAHIFVLFYYYFFFATHIINLWCSKTHNTKAHIEYTTHITAARSKEEWFIIVIKFSRIHDECGRGEKTTTYQTPWQQRRRWTMETNQRKEK